MENNGHNKNVQEFFRGIASSYDQIYSHPFYTKIWDTITWDYIYPYLPNVGKVLDAGGGTGKWALRIAENQNLSVTIYDLSTDLLERASMKINSLGISNVLCAEGDICKIPFDNESFDFVCALGEPISYCYDPVKAIQELSRVLCREGHIVVDACSLYGKIRSLIEYDLLSLEEVIETLQKRTLNTRSGFTAHLFTPESLSAILESASIRIKKVIGKIIVTQKFDPLSGSHRKEKVNEKLVEIEKLMCEEPALIGSAESIQIVGQKGG